MALLDSYANRKENQIVRRIKVCFDPLVKLINKLLTLNDFGSS